MDVGEMVGLGVSEGVGFVVGIGGGGASAKRRSVLPPHRTSRRKKPNADNACALGPRTKA